APPSLLLVPASSALRAFHPSPTRRSSDLGCVACTEHAQCPETACRVTTGACFPASNRVWVDASADCDAGNGSETNPYCEVTDARSEEHTSELQSRENLVCRLLLEKKKKQH